MSRAAFDGWWHVDGDSQAGPLSEHALRRRIVQGAIGIDTPMWRTGMAEWLPLGDIPELGALLAEIEAQQRIHAPPVAPDMPMVEAALAVGPSPAGPWSRFVARELDMMLAYGVISLAVLLIGGAGIKLHSGYFVAMVLLQWSPLPMLLDATLLSAIGATPGKWLLGVQVRRTDGAKLKLGQAWQRALHLWVYGFGCNLPIVNLVTRILAYRALRQGRQLRWDQLGGDVVTQPVRKPGWRMLFVVLLILAAWRIDYQLGHIIAKPMQGDLKNMMQDLHHEMGDDDED